MKERVLCEICNRTFKDRDGLAQHKDAKHIQNLSDLSSSSINNRFNFKKIRNWAILISIIAIVFWVFSISVKGSDACKTDPVIEINIGSHQNLALHTHADLEIIINGISREIPANIGIALGIMRPIHTHDASGEIHMEGPCIRDFKLGEFFQVWGKRFNSNCIFDFCTGNGTLTISVNEKENDEFDNYIMRDKDEIMIEYKANK